MTSCGTAFVANPFVQGTPLPFRSTTRPSNKTPLSHRPARQYSRTTITARTPPKKSKKPNKPKNPANSDPFSSFAAGPSTRTAPRISRRKPTSPDKSTEADPEPDSEPESDVEETSAPDVAESVESKRAVRALGSQSDVDDRIVTSKTAADFIAEGVVDDVDEESSLSFMGDIKFGIDDISDPFKEKEGDMDIEGSSSEQVVDEDPIGKLMNVTGDGGVQKKLISVGSGSVISPNSKVKVEYTGKLDNGTVFDSSRNRDESFVFQLGKGTVIKGWEAAISTMCVGEVSEFVISSQYAYGKRGMPPVIPGNATLTFEIELMEALLDEVKDVKNIPEFNPSIPRTPSDIAESYAKKMDSADDKKNRSFFERFYFISPFMSQTGERPPWWINPNITFVIIALTTVLGFYLVVKSGAIHVGFYDENVDVNIFK